MVVLAHDAPTGPGEYDTFCFACQACSRHFKFFGVALPVS